MLYSYFCSAHSQASIIPPWLNSIYPCFLRSCSRSPLPVWLPVNILGVYSSVCVCVLQWHSFLCFVHVCVSICFHCSCQSSASAPSALFVLDVTVLTAACCSATRGCLAQSPAQPALILACCSGTSRGAPPEQTNTCTGPSLCLSLICFYTSPPGARAASQPVFSEAIGSTLGLVRGFLVHVVIVILSFDLPTLTTLYSKGLPPPPPPLCLPHPVSASPQRDCCRLFSSSLVRKSLPGS